MRHRNRSGRGAALVALPLLLTACAALVALPLLLTACAARFDAKEARRLLERPVSPAIPDFREETAEQMAAPEGLRAESGELRAVPLRWDPLLSSDVGGYVIERSLLVTGPFRRLAAVGGRATTAYVDTDDDPLEDAEETPPLDDGATRAYRVRAFHVDGRLAARASQVVTATTAAPPRAPDGLRAYSHQPREVPLSWNPASEALVAGYAIERSPSSQGPFAEVARLEGRHAVAYLDRSLGDLRVFYYRVRSLNAAGGRGEASRAVRAVTKPEPLPPYRVRVVERRLGVNRLRWEPNVEKDLHEYRLIRVRESAGAPEIIAVLPRDATRAEDDEVGSGERVSYAMVALDGDGLKSVPSAPVEVQSAGYDLTARVRQDGIRLRWNARRDEGFVGARILAVGGRTEGEVAFVEGSSYVHPEAEGGRRYRFTVILERADASRAPPSQPIEISVPAS